MYFLLYLSRLCKSHSHNQSVQIIKMNNETHPTVGQLRMGQGLVVTHCLGAATDQEMAEGLTAREGRILIGGRQGELFSYVIVRFMKLNHRSIRYFSLGRRMRWAASCMLPTGQHLCHKHCGVVRFIFKSTSSDLQRARSFKAAGLFPFFLSPSLSHLLSRSSFFFSYTTFKLYLILQKLEFPEVQELGMEQVAKSSKKNQSLIRSAKLPYLIVLQHIELLSGSPISPVIFKVVVL